MTIRNPSRNCDPSGLKLTLFQQTYTALKAPDLNRRYHATVCIVSCAGVAHSRLAHQVHHGFQMVGLRKQIDQVELFDAIACCL
jgi:hypothetical protein